MGAQRLIGNGYVTIRSGPERPSPRVRGLVEIGLEACHAGALVALAAVHAFAAGINHTTDTALGADDERA
jgi:hypothetical protein